jgi:hypothetical protein
MEEEDDLSMLKIEGMQPAGGLIDQPSLIRKSKKSI